MTWTISIQGQVQGVGFRPYVWRAALDRNLTGWVANGLEGVLIKINGTEAQAIDFHQYLLAHKPSTACITATSLAPDDAAGCFDHFSIRESRADGRPVLHLTPDVAICPACRQDLHNPANRRFGYAFTTCTVCGPRYSILTGLPYDRPLTTMAPFNMCPACQAEYDSPADRRYYAQTNSCPACGIALEFRHFKQIGNNSSADAIQQTIAAWRAGAIVAIKGIGGFLLTCDAGNRDAIAEMRTRKQRPTKPFAVMYPNIALLQDDLEAGDVAIQQLESAAAPIVLLRVKKHSTPQLDLAGIAPGLHQIGAMLPNAPLFEVLLSHFGGPIVATSCNISHAPLLYEDEVAGPELSQLADCVLTHNRAIVMPQDDSLVSLRQQADGISLPVVLRRARGLAPAFIQTNLPVPEPTVLALGAELKSTFTLTHLGNVNISQYLGDLSDFDTQERYHLALRHLTGLFNAQPTVVIGDLHPGYYTTQLGQDLARQWQAPWIQVQHHEAHFAAILAENDLFSSEAPVLGVIWDGTGLGTDGQIWGGEFFIYTSKKPSTQAGLFNRCAQMAYFPVLLGDKMAREPRLSALSACRDLPDADAFLKPKFTAVEWNLYKKLIGRNDQIQTSSAGRLFDAVAAMLGLADQVSYEGEAGLLLEDLARSYCDRHGFDFEGAYSIGIDAAEAPVKLRTTDLLRQIIRDLEAGEDKAHIAAKFHGALVDSIGRMAGQLHIKNIAFSGGVFQNALLLDMIPSRLGPDYHLYFHRQLSPNDENISFGQWAYAVHNGTIPLH